MKTCCGTDDHKPHSKDCPNRPKWKPGLIGRLLAKYPKGKGLRIFVSFSGGRSSALMCKIVLETFPEAEIVFVFANTGKEHEKTLIFTKNVSEFFGLNLIWVEGVAQDGRNGSTHRIVTFETASRLETGSKPFFDMIQKYGIPNTDFPHCTRELKMNPMTSFMRSIGWNSGEYWTALGIRGDEPLRLSVKAEEYQYFYPLAENGIDKQDVLNFWATMPFDLGIKEREGNCVDCWKKTDTKLVANIQRNPEWFDFNKRMERDFHTLPIVDQHDCEKHPYKYEKRVFFRKRRSTEDMFRLAECFDEPVNDLVFNRPNQNAGCSESCEATPEELNDDYEPRSAGQKEE